MRLLLTRITPITRMANQKKHLVSIMKDKKFQLLIPLGLPRIFLTPSTDLMEMKFKNDCDYCIYFSKEFGELASYSIDWFNLLLIDSISDNEKLQFIKPLTTKLEQDTLFFPYPDSLRRNHDEIRQNSLRMELEF